MLELERIWGGNSVHDWALALGLALSINVIIGLTRWIILKYLSKAANPSQAGVNSAIVAMVRRTKQLLVFGVTLLIGTRYLELPDKLDHLFIHIATVAAFLQLGLWLNAVLTFWVNRYRYNNLSTDAGANTSLAALTFVAKLLLWVILTLVALANLGVNVSAMVAGLGVGGIAIALAVQNILGDLLASLSIVIDKPFVIGDAITIDTYSGTVEHVGLKTTRLRSSTGEQIIIANGDLLKTRIRNYKRMEERRITFGFGVVYEISPELLESIPGMVKAIVESIPRMRFERASFRGFGASSLDFEVVFWALNPNFMESVDAQQRINLAIFKQFKEAGIAFAYPTQTLIVQGPEPFPGTHSGRASRSDIGPEMSPPAPGVT